MLYCVGIHQPLDDYDLDIENQTMDSQSLDSSAPAFTWENYRPNEWATLYDENKQPL